MSDALDPGQPQPNASSRSPGCGTHGSAGAVRPGAADPASSPAALESWSGYPGRVAGCLLGKMCGDVLGASVEGWSAADVLRAHPEGLTAFAHTRRGYGCYTDDTQMAIALVRSLLERGGRVDDVHAALAYAAEYEFHRGYGGTAFKILSVIKEHGIDAASIATIGTRFIPAGSFGNGGAMRIAPLGLAYRHAPPDVLRSAVAAALRCTHVHPVAVDGAMVVALAAGYLATRAPGPGPGPAERSADGPGPTADGMAVDAEGGATSAADGAVGAQDGAQGAADGKGSGGGGGGGQGVATPAGLLAYLLRHSGHLETEGVVEKLRTVQAALGRAPRFKSAAEPWSRYFASSGWEAELALQAEIAEPFQIRADDAAAAAVAALTWHWDCPEDAVVAAVHFGGDTDTVAAITGALAGSLHGVSWVPRRWWDALENGPAGRDELLALAGRLAELDTRA